MGKYELLYKNKILKQRRIKHRVVYTEKRKIIKKQALKVFVKLHIF